MLPVQSLTSDMKGNPFVVDGTTTLSTLVLRLPGGVGGGAPPSNNIAVQPTTASAANKDYFQWTEARKLSMAKTVSANKGHVKNGVSMKVKWELILGKLKEKPGFESLSITALTLQNAFKRDQGLVLEKFGFSKEQVNLSALDGVPPSEYESLHLELAEEDYRSSNKRRAAQEKEARKKRYAL